MTTMFKNVNKYYIIESVKQATYKIVDIIIISNIKLFLFIYV